jgi:DNA-binding transcriptional ArsR family regulator/anti-sigma regulatory factor (Ser/Thr protein kinase)
MIHEQRTHRDADRAEINVRVVAYLENEDPEITEVSAGSPGAATAKLSRLIERKVSEMEGEVPERSVREVVENLVHAGYRGVVISILDGGNTVRVSDKGPGISSKGQAVEFGFSGATEEALRQIRGVGAGLGIAKSEVEKAGGRLHIEDNLGGGTVVTVSVSRAPSLGEDAPEPEGSQKPQRAQKSSAQPRYPGEVPKINISERQQNVLVTVLECGEVGPSTIADRLEMSVSTAYRDLSVLEEHGLVSGDESGKRVISPLGRDCVEAIIGSWVK